MSDLIFYRSQPDPPAAAASSTSQIKTNGIDTAGQIQLSQRDSSLSQISKVCSEAYKCRWVSNFFNLTLGGIDGASSQPGEGTNGSLHPACLKEILKVLCNACTVWDGTSDANNVPSLIDAGCAEGRVFLHWADMLFRQQIVIASEQARPTPLMVYGIELPPNKVALSCIHKAACVRARTAVGYEMKITAVWKSCSAIGTLRQEFSGLADGSYVMFSFWTAWKPSDKENLLRLVACEESVLAVALCFRRGDLNVEGGAFDEAHVLQQLANWEKHYHLEGCKLIGGGSETVTCIVFKRTAPQPLQAKMFQFIPLAGRLILK